MTRADDPAADGVACGISEGLSGVFISAVADTGRAGHSSIAQVGVAHGRCSPMRKTGHARNLRQYKQGMLMFMELAGLACNSW